MVCRISVSGITRICACEFEWKRFLMSASDLEVLQSSIAEVLVAECGRRDVHAFVDGKNKLDETLWRTAASLGWLGVGFSEEFGGLGLAADGLDILHTEIGRNAAPGPFIATLCAAQWIAEVAPQQLRATYLERVAAGDLKIAVPALLNGRPHDLALDGGRATGETPLLLGSATSSLVIIPVWNANGAAWALIEPDGERAQLLAQPMWDRTRELCTLRCKGAPVAALIDDADGRMLRVLQRHLSLALASDSIGGAEAILEQTVEYMKTRVQFGKPIGSFQALKHRVADMTVRLATDRNLLAQAVESAASPSGDMWAALAKASITDGFRLTAADCLQLHGGIGFTWDYDCHLFLKRARLNEMLVGANGAQRDFAASELAAITLAGGTSAELAA